MILNNLAVYLWTGREQLGGVDNLNEAIICCLRENGSKQIRTLNHWHDVLIIHNRSTFIT